MATSSHEDFNQQWHQRWQKNEIGFHVKDVQPWLVEHWPLLVGPAQEQSPCVFVPLCGKTLDIEYFLKQGYVVVGCELSELAIKQLFDQLAITPSISAWGDGLCYQGENIRVYVGDFFTLTQADLMGVNYIYDRAALIALSTDTRVEYCKRLIDLCPKARQLVITLDYDSQKKQGPPYGVSGEEMQLHYQASHNIKRVLHENIIEDEPRFKKRGLTSLFESLYWLEPISEKTE